MSNLPKEWRFLRAAWIYAYVLTGRPHAATDLVSSTLTNLIDRQDIVGAKRLRRLFFATLFREGCKSRHLEAVDFEGDAGLLATHQLSEPGRSALALLHLRIFPPDQLADVLEKNENELPAILDSARAELESKLHPSA